MTRAEQILETSRDMDTSTFLQHLLLEEFPQQVVVTSSLRGRSVVVLKLISEIEPSTPIVFCHVPELFPESHEYRTMLIDKLGLTDIREPTDDAGPLADDTSHYEGLWAENPEDHSRVYKTIHLNRTLADFECWVGAVYHGPYPDTPPPRVREEGRLVRIDPMAPWTQEDVRRFMTAHDLPYHPMANLRRPSSTPEAAKSTPSYHY